MYVDSSFIVSPAEQIARYKAAHSRLMGKPKQQSIHDRLKINYELSYGFKRLANVTTHAMILTDLTAEVRYISSRDFVRRIISIVSDQQKISIPDILSPRRAKNLVFARHLALYLAVKHTKLSLPVIGRLVGDRDHSTIIHARDSMTKKRASDPKVDALLSSLEVEILKERPAVWS